MLLNVLLWIIYDPGRVFFGVSIRVVIVLFLLTGVPALMYIGIIRIRCPDFRTSSRVAAFDGVPGICTVIADPGPRFLQEMGIRIPA